MYTYYVLGFCFTPNKEKVLLINKLKPDWQKGFLNGIGGKVKANETDKQAMCREGVEEAGLDYIHWTYCGDIEGDNYSCTIYNSFELNTFQQIEEELLELVDVSKINTINVIPNLKILIPFCILQEDCLIELTY